MALYAGVFDRVSLLNTRSAGIVEGLEPLVPVRAGPGTKKGHHRSLVPRANRAVDQRLLAPVGMEDCELRIEALRGEREAILQLRNERVINDEVMRRIQRDIDLAEARLRRR